MDYNEKQKIRKIFSEKGLPEGLCLGSKTKYKDRNTGNEVLFNALIYLSESYYDLLKQGELGFKFPDFLDNYGKLEEYQIWHGDLNLTQSKNSLEKITKGLGEDLVITDEFTKKQKDIRV